MGVSFRIMPGLRISASSRGIRAGVGPRIARVHVGAGRTGVSTGLGPFGAYTSLRGGRRAAPRRGVSVAAQERAVRQAERLKRVEATLELDRAFVDDFLTVHRQSFDVAQRPIAPPATPVDVRAHRREQRAAALKGVSVLKRAERKAAKAQADERAEAMAAEDALRNETAAAEQQQQLDDWWTRLVANDEEAVLMTLHASEDNDASAAAVVGCDGGSVSPLMRFPPVDSVLPESKADVTPTGRPTIKKRTKTERNDLYLAAVMSHALVTVKEAFAVAPALEEARILAIIDHDHVLVAFVYARFEQRDLANVDWQNLYPEEITVAVAKDGVVSSKDPSALRLGGQPELLQAVEQIAEQLGAQLDPACRSG
jgi:hypothetical protein